MSLCCRYAVRVTRSIPTRHSDKTAAFVRRLFASPPVPWRAVCRRDLRWVRFKGKTGNHLLTSRLAGFDPRLPPDRGRGVFRCIFGVWSPEAVVDQFYEEEGSLFVEAYDAFYPGSGPADRWRCGLL
jgi:hypothetical protein